VLFLFILFKLFIAKSSASHIAVQRKSETGGKSHRFVFSNFLIIQFVSLENGI
jgi:hypothetical protein